MFRLFRRRKKDKKKEKVVEEEIKSTTEIPEIIEESQEAHTKTIEDPQVTEIPFEERFASIPKIITEPIPELPDIPPKPILDFLPFVATVTESEDSIFSFISPEILQHHPEIEEVIPKVSRLTVAELPPVTLEERIEGALFSVGRPIHVTELIESLQEESPIVKRTLRKVARQMKRTSPIVIEEISRDRWVLQLNPIYHEFFQSIVTERFMTQEERRILTEIAYRQPISLAMVKKIVKKIGPVKITEICRHLEARGYIIGEPRARSLVYTTTPKFANDFGFDDESRRLKLQMLWRLKRLMGDVYEEEPEEEDLEDELQEEKDEVEEETEEQIEEIETFEEAETGEEIEETIEVTDVIKDTNIEEIPVAEIKEEEE
ncbi:MAG: SMC-Scp complex subunit ScpB [Promethearchaeota archaeon]